MSPNEACGPVEDGTKGTNQVRERKGTSTTDNKSGCKDAVITVLAVFCFFLLAALVTTVVVHLTAESKWETKVQALTSDKSALDQNLNEKTSEIATLTTENTELHQNLTRTTTDVEALTMEKTVLNQNLKEKTNEIDILTTENTKLNQNLKHKATAVQELTTENTVLSRDLTEQKTKVETMTTENAELNTDLNEKNTEIETLNSKNAELTDSLDEKTIEVETLTTENAKLNTNLDEKTTEIEALHSKNVELTDRLDEKTTALENITMESAKLSEHLKNISSDPCLKKCEGRNIEQIAVTLDNGTVTYRDVSNDDENWMVFQRRMNGHVNFERDWDDYVNGFGSTCEEHWLGLEVLHQLTKSGDKKLRIDMVVADTGIRYYAEYSTITVAAASDNYRLQLGGFSGNMTSDALLNITGAGTSNGMQFSTYDVDNDLVESVNCAKNQGSGWWQKSCTWANLNGLYGPIGHSRGIWWNGEFLHFVEMKIKKK